MVYNAAPSYTFSHPVFEAKYLQLYHLPLHHYTRRGQVPHGMRITVLVLGVGAALVRGQVVLYVFPLFSCWKTLQEV